ncbi:hypothetical protein QR680_000918 [Steinernema hermaphroditum]|uniref:Uncharacterized protein n=1 Tax=Steinernema hermaphroditum TaxID=289476 RepID=A0AA39LEX9_9BILA|nr:hypothetical protein QR680_000918 [Steinernema hermaphroditum]
MITYLLSLIVKILFYNFIFEHLLIYFIVVPAWVIRTVEEYRIARRMAKQAKKEAKRVSQMEAETQI